ncbi:MAG: HK97-gp10 family putative phage morphogenesis protein [Candidatus Neomarinimicrobiota bacterium]|jgi:HK97 gp10 family phage protein
MSTTKDAFRFELFGMKELMDALDELPTIAMQKSIVRNAAKRALKPTAELYKSALPWAPKPKQYAKSKHLRDSVEITSALKRSQKKDGRRVGKDEIVMYVGSSAPHAHLVEWGTVERKHKTPTTAPIGDVVRVVQETGRVPAKPYLRQAWESTKIGVIKIFSDEMKKELEKAAKRLAAKATKGTLTKRQRAGLMR